MSAKTVLGRRLEKHDEDEDDRRERHHLEATLKLMGVDRGSTFSDSTAKNGAQGKQLVKTQSRYAHSGEERESLIQPSRPVSGEPSGKSTPLSRLSSVLGTSDSPVHTLSPELTGRTDLPPDLAAEAVLREFDLREAKHVKALSKGKVASGYTSPPPGNVRRPSGSRRIASGGSNRSSGQGFEVERKTNASPRKGQADEEGEKVRQSGSISTLWSMGSSRPNSQEIPPR